MKRPKDFLKGYYHLDFVEEYLDSFIRDNDISDEAIIAFNNEEFPTQQAVIDKINSRISAEIRIMKASGYTNTKIREFLQGKYGIAEHKGVALIKKVVSEVYDELSKSKKELIVDYSLMIELATELARKKEDVRTLLDIAKEKLKQAGISENEMANMNTIQSLFGDIQ